MDNLTIVQHRRGTTADWKKYSNLILKEGEIGVEFCEDGTTLIKVGNGHASYEDLKPITASDEKFEELYTYVDNQITDVGTTIQSEVESEVKSSINNLVLVDGLTYQDSALQLVSNGKPVGGPIFIEAGSGGSGAAWWMACNATLLSDPSMTVQRKKECLVTYKVSCDRMFQDGSSVNIPNSRVTTTLYVNDVRQKSETVEQGEYPIDVSPYLTVGDNEVRIHCADMQGNTAEVRVFINVVELRLTSTFNDAIIQEGEIKFNYTPYPTMNKTVHFIIDDKDELTPDVVTQGGQQVTKTINKLPHGSHTLEAYLSTTIDDTDIESSHLKFEFVSIEKGNETPIIASLYSGVTSEQGELISIPYLVYDPLRLTSDIILTVTDENGETFSTQKLTVDRNKQYWNIRNYPIGEATFTISYGDISKSHKVSVSENDISVEAVTNELELYLSSANRRNDEQNPAVWSYNGITTEFENFNWKSNGWCEDSNKDVCLRFTGGARATIDFQPFANDLKTNGKTIEFEFAVRNVNNRDAVVLDCFDGTIGIQATPDTAFLKSQGNIVSCNYKENERVRVSFSIQSSAEDTRFISTYLDGTLSGITRYSTTDNFEQFGEPLSIRLGSEYCELDLYSIRVYGTCLSDKQILQNYIADMAEFSTKVQLYEDNDIYDDYTQEISYRKVKGKVPTIIFIGKMPTFKGDKRPYKNASGKPIPGTEVRMIFEHPQHPELNFDELLSQIDVQGTSSAGYVRKNWKTKHPKEHTHMTDELPSKVFCIKVDYAEATGTHNTQNANLIETFYNKPIPPMDEDNYPSSMTDEEKEDLSKVRTTIAGFPVVIFHLDTDNTNTIKNITTNELALRTDLIFSSKGNFNYDKDSEDVFAFNDNYDVECWEFLKNEDPQSFLTPWPENPMNYWEARYHPRLGELEDLQDAKNETAAKALGDEMLSRFKVMYEWVHSTARGTYAGKPQASGEELSSPYIDSLNKEYTHDTDEYRLAKFRNEFENYFDLHYAAIYYVYTFFALMVDQRAKNMFLTYWRDNAYGPNDDTNPGRWYPYFYDNDTSYGISNKGHLDFDYYHQDTDSINGSNVFNGASSVLWSNFAEAFSAVIQNTYKELRNSGKLTYAKVIDQFVSKGSDQWSASIYNEDADYKYVSVDSDTVEGETQAYPYLFQVRGNGEQHLKYFVENRIKFCDSKWKCGDYLNTSTHTASVNIYNPTSSVDYQDCLKWENDDSDDKGAPPAYYDTYEKIKESVAVRNPGTEIVIKPYSRMYYAVQYGMPSGDDQTKGMVSKLAENTTDLLHFEHSDTTQLNDFETTIYGARDISSLGDLSSLYPKQVVVKNAVKLTELLVGCQEEGPNGEKYYNPNLTSLEVGANTLLKKIDISNCPNLTSSFDVSGCTNIEEIYAEGSGITSVVLPSAGYLRVMRLPQTINNLTLKNQPKLEDLSFENYEGLTTLCIDNCPSLKSDELLEKCKDSEGNYTVQFLRLTGINWKFENADFLETLSELRGKDANDNNTDHAYLVGTCHIEELTGQEMEYIRNLYPYLTITFDKLTLTIEYKDESGSETIYTYTETVLNGSTDNPITILDPIKNNLIANKNKYTTKNSTAEHHFIYGGWSKLSNSEPDEKSLTGVITNVVRYVAFRKETRQYRVRFYNEDKLLGEQYIDYGKDAYYSEEQSLKKPNTSAPYQFSHWEPSEKGIINNTDCYAKFHLDMSDIPIFSLDDFLYSISNGKIELRSYTGNSTIGIIPSTFEIGGVNYPVVVGGFARTNINYVIISEGITSIASRAFQECANLEYVHIPKTVTSIGEYAFQKCSLLSEINLPDGLTAISKNMLQNCESLKSITLPDSITSIGSMGLYTCAYSNLTIPAAVTTIGMFAFKSNRTPPALRTVYFMGTPTQEIPSDAFQSNDNVTFYVPWSEDSPANVNAPWGALNYTINYNYRYD